MKLAISGRNKKDTCPNLQGTNEFPSLPIIVEAVQGKRNNAILTVQYRWTIKFPQIVVTVTSVVEKYLM